MSNTITAFFKGRVGVAESVYQHDYGRVIILDKLNLGQAFDAYFEILGEEEAIPAIGQDDRVAIPNSCLANPGKVTLHIPVHSTQNDSEVEYIVTFAVIGRAKPVDDGTPAEQTAIAQALALLQNPIAYIEQIVNEALAFTGKTFEEMQEDLDEWKGGVESDFDNLDAQFQTAVSAVTTDTEVTNIRVGDDNVTYTAAGEAVRKQFAAVKSAINEAYDQLFDFETVTAPQATTRIESNYTLFYGAKAEKAFFLKSVKTPYVNDKLGAYSLKIYRYNSDSEIWEEDENLTVRGVAPDTEIIVNSVINVNDVIALANTYPLVDDTKANCYSTNSPSEKYLEYFGNLQVYSSSTHKFTVYSSSAYFAGTIIAGEANIANIEYDVANNIEAIEGLRTIKGEYQAISTTTVNDKYIYQDGTSSSNGTIQNDVGAGYAKILVKAGEHYKISGASNRYKPLVVMFNSETIGHSGYVGAVGGSVSQVVHDDYEITIPDNIVMICVNTTNYTSYPIVVKKFMPTQHIKYLSDLNINSFAKNPLEYVGNDISLFNKILCIGDSLTLGGLNTPPITPDDSHATRVTTEEMYSYPHNLYKNFGCEYTIKATGGITSSEWIQNYGNDDLTGHDCAIIFLGSNDYMMVTHDGMTAAEAIAANNANLETIITLVQSQNYGIPIFLCTAFPDWSDAYGVTVGCNTNIRTICGQTNGVYLIDFREYSLLNADSPYRYTHPTALGYMQMAKEIAGAVCYHITQNPTDFKWVQYVGTRWAVEIS